jgi:molybdopterin/thiamine biosynthesis adenylyltransferase
VRRHVRLRLLTVAAVGAFACPGCSGLPGTADDAGGGAPGDDTPASTVVAANAMVERVVDGDTVELTNLQRQIAHTTDRVGHSKVSSAKEAMLALNPDIQVTALPQKADAQLLAQLLPNTHVVLDCSDNFQTRHMLNLACVQNRIPLVSGAVIRLDGQLTTYDPRRADSPCYACVFPPDQAPEEISCATMGVLAPLVGVIGSLQAAEAVKLLTHLGDSLVGRLQMLDGRSLSWTEMRLRRQAACSVCGSDQRS